MELFKTVPAYVAGVFKDGEPVAPVVKWSGDKPPPAIGDLIVLRFNRIGNARVVGYAVDYDWLGVMCVPLDPPAWWVAQNGPPSESNSALAYGCEIA